jgi:hypothetical protein
MTDAPVDLDELETLAKAATPGPWTHKSDINGLSNFVYKGSGMRRQVARTLKLSDDSDAAFIAALNPAVALALIAEVRAARAPVEAGVVTREHRKVAAALVRESDGNPSLAAWVSDGDVNEGNWWICDACVMDAAQA